MVSVQLSHLFNRGNEFGVVFKLQPPFINIRDRGFDRYRSFRRIHYHQSGSVRLHLFLLRRRFGEAAWLGVEPRILMFRENAAPSIGEVKRRHVEHEHPVVPTRTWSKNLGQESAVLLARRFSFHSTKFSASSPSHHKAVAGFSSASFEG